MRAAARLFRVAGGRATILCLKTKGGPRGPGAAHFCPHLPASEQTDLQGRRGGRGPVRGQGTSARGIRNLHPPSKPEFLQCTVLYI